MLNKNNKTLLIIVSIAIILISGLAIYYFFFSESEDATVQDINTSISQDNDQEITDSVFDADQQSENVTTSTDEQVESISENSTNDAELESIVEGEFITTPNGENSESGSLNIPELTKSYTNETIPGFSFKYPENWNIEENQVGSIYYSNIFGYEVTLSDPTHQLTLTISPSRLASCGGGSNLGIAGTEVTEKFSEFIQGQVATYGTSLQCPTAFLIKSNLNTNIDPGYQEMISNSGDILSAEEKQNVFFDLEIKGVINNQENVIYREIIKSITL